ncbi:MAG: SCO family protein [Gammaproteobacteria bacterium]
MFSHKRCIQACLYVLGVSLLLSACHSGPPWQTKDISGLMPRLAFTLTEANRDKLVHATDYRGKYALLYFGYTHCPDVCPLTLTRLKRVLSNLGSAAQDVRVLFVTVDPKRDTLSILKRYTEFYGPHIRGLRGTQPALRELTKMYRVTYGYGKADAQGNYAVSHSSAIYVFDREGRARLLFRPTDSVAAITADMKRLIAENP